MPRTTWPTVISGVTITFFSAVMPGVNFSSGFMAQPRISLDRARAGRCVSPRLAFGEPRAEPVEVEINYGRCVKRQDLREHQTADDGVAQRLTELRTCAGADHQRHAAEQRGHRRHQDRPEPQRARLVDRIPRTEAVLALLLEREIDQHDAVLLDDADQENDADDGDDAE